MQLSIVLLLCGSALLFVPSSQTDSRADGVEVGRLNILPKSALMFPVVRKPLTWTVYQSVEGTWQPVTSVTGTGGMVSDPIPVGTYKLRITDPSGWYKEGWWRAQPGYYSDAVENPQDGTDLTIVANQNTYVAPDPEGSCSISGRVCDEVTGEPIPGAKIRSIGRITAARFGLQISKYWGQTTSAPDGTYLLRGLTPDDYQLFCEGGDPPSHMSEFWHEEPTKLSGESFEVTPGATVADRDFMLDRTGAITGRVVKSTDGLPVAGAKVTVNQGYRDPQWRIRLGSCTTSTNADGEFTLVGLYPVQTTVVVTGDSSRYELATAVATMASAPATLALSDIVLPIGGRIIANVTFVPAEGPNHATLCVFPPGGSPVSGDLLSATYGSNTYKSHLAGEGSYLLWYQGGDHNSSSRYWPDSLTPEGAQLVTVTAGCSTEVTVTILRPTRLSTRVRSAQPGVMRGSYWATLWERQPDGSFKVKYETWMWDSWPYQGDLDGVYRLTIEDTRGWHEPVGWPSGVGLEDAQDIVLARGQVRSFDVTLTPRYGVLDLMVRESPSGRAVSLARVRAVYPATNKNESFEVTAVADSTGRVRLAGLMPGEWLIEVDGPLGQAAHTPVTVPFSVLPSSTAEAEIPLPKRGSFSGRVLEEGTGYPIPGAIVVHSSAGTSCSVAVCDSLGRYFGQPLDAGDYVPSVFDPSGRHYSLSPTRPIEHLEPGATVTRKYLLTRVGVSRPHSPAVVSHDTPFRLYGYLKPRSTAGTRPVRIYRWHLVSGRWLPRGYVGATVEDYSTYSRYSRVTRLRYHGKWRLRACVPMDESPGTLWSSTYTYVTVR